MKDNIPTTSIPIRYCYGKLKGIFHVWQVQKLSARNMLEKMKEYGHPAIFIPTKWQWSAMGGNGEEETQEKAIEAARLWIVNNYIKQGE